MQSHRRLRPEKAMISTHLKRSIITGLAIIGASVVIPASAMAQVYFEYNFPIKKDNNDLKPNPDGTPPWLLVTLEQVSNDIVSMQINPYFADTGQEYANAFVSQLSFNLLIEPPTITANGTCSSDVSLNYCTDFLVNYPNGQPPVEYQSNNTSGDGVGVFSGTKGFDLLVNLPNGPNSNVQLTSGKQVKFNLYGLGLTPESFSATNPSYTTPGYPPSEECIYCNLSEAKIQGITADSTVIYAGSPLTAPDPKEDEVPSPLPIVGAVSAWSYARRLRRRSRDQQQTMATSAGSC